VNGGCFSSFQIETVENNMYKKIKPFGEDSPRRRTQAWERKLERKGQK